MRVRLFNQFIIDFLKDTLITDHPFVGAEVGVWKGNTSTILLRTFPQLTLMMVDSWEKMKPDWTNPSLSFTEEEVKKAHIGAIENTDFASDRRRVLFDTSEDASKQIDDDSLDFVFIDGDHLYEGIYNDLRWWFPKVRTGGVFSGHDYEKRFGVKRAVDEFALEHGYSPEVKFRTWWFVK